MTKSKLELTMISDHENIKNNLSELPVNLILKLGDEMSGEILTGLDDRLMYATDASEFRSVPLAVALPKNREDIKKLITFARENGTHLIPRAAGTSLAGQVVGDGIVVDIGKYMNRIIDVNKAEKWVVVEPGVVLDELNELLKKSGLFFAPETSTSSRCMVGGMAGNNACGSHSLIYGSTRDHVLSVKAILSDGSEALFESLDISGFLKKCKGENFESGLYRNIRDIFGNENVRASILNEYPDKKIRRRNTGYAVDELINTTPFGGTEKFNFSKLLVGSEGTLAFITELKLNLVPLPPPEKILICIHFKDMMEAIDANLIVLDHRPDSVELIDGFILDSTKNNIDQLKNRFFIKGDPDAVLIVEFSGESMPTLEKKAKYLEEILRKKNLGYYFPVIKGTDTDKIWSLRKAGLGVIMNVPGDLKPVTVMEDTAVNPKNLKDYIADIKKILEKKGLKTCYYGHIATGELHIRPMINLKSEYGVELFRSLGEDVARLVKKYNGSLSGEHGDGRLRGEFIPIMIGRENYNILRTIKKTWDPGNILNPGKITDTPPMDSSLKYRFKKVESEINTYFDFKDGPGILRSVEKCNGSADCRQTGTTGGTMCPSYLATRDEKNSTRARANILREFLSFSKKENPFDHDEIFKVMDLCLSCKACKSECPSSIDMTKFKAEFLQHYYESHGIPLRTRLVAFFPFLSKLGSSVPSMYNFLVSNFFTSRILKKIIGFAPARSIPLLAKTTLKLWLNKSNKNNPDKEYDNGTVFLFADEFTDYNDTQIGIKAITVLQKLGYRVIIPKHLESGRTYLSKGLVKKASETAKKNVNLLKDIICDEKPLVGIEPSAILTFRDEYPELVGRELKGIAEALGQNCLMFDEFIDREIESGKIVKGMFTKESMKIKLHGHCHQKSIASTESTKKMLSFPENYTVEEISSGCCGMAGSFGFEKEHYELSMKVGELVLFPEIRKTSDEIVISAPGTSCRQQIKEGTDREALHPIEIFYNAFKDEEKLKE